MIPFLRRGAPEPEPAPVIVPETIAPPADLDRRERVSAALAWMQAAATGQPRPAVPPLKDCAQRLVYQFPCTGLCAGDGCEKCQTLADHITRTKALKNIEFQRRRIRALEAEVAALTAQNKTMKERR